jgi:hypothetical protein
MLRNALPPSAEPLPDLEARSIHSVEVYRAILSTGVPILRLPDPPALVAVAEWLARHQPEGVDLGTLVDRAASAVTGTAGSDAVKLTLLAFTASGVFERSPEGLPLAEQKLKLSDPCGSAPLILETVYRTAEKKLSATLGEVDSRLLRELIPALNSS